VAAVVTSADIEQVCHDRGFLFFTTHVSDPLAAAVALTVLRVIQRDDLVLRSELLGRQLGERLLDLQQRYEEVGDTRGRGLLRGMELVTDKATKTPADTLGKAVTAACLERGLHLNIVQLPGMGGIFRIAPPLTIGEDELHSGLDILEASLKTVLATGSP
jgi:2,2-dialkylglycine decarboxylase (pyruvate)